MANYWDADLSGYDKRVVRTDFERMLADIDAGLMDAMFVWQTDRLTRGGCNKVRINAVVFVPETPGTRCSGQSCHT